MVRLIYFISHYNIEIVTIYNIIVNTLNEKVVFPFVYTPLSLVLKLKHQLI